MNLHLTIVLSDSMQEVWKEIPRYEGLYEASTCGQIRSIDGKITSSARFEKRVWKQRIIKQKLRKNKNGRLDPMVTLWLDGKPHYHLVSRLIATTFIEDCLYSKLTINHKGGNPLNNNVNNLEWMTRADNIKYGFEHGQYPAQKVALTNDDETLYFRSMSEASRFLRRYNGYISAIIKSGREIASSADGDVYLVWLVEPPNE